MNRVIKSTGPPLAMLTVVSYLCWGHLAPPHQLEAPRPKMPTLNPKRLNPDLTDRYERDPFRTTAVATKADQIQDDDDARLRANLRAERRQVQVVLSEHVQQMSLNGAVLGKHPQAIINQHIFKIGDVITLADTHVPLRVEGIGRNWVSLDNEFIRAKLTYGEPAQITMLEDAARPPGNAMCHRTTGGSN